MQPRRGFSLIEILVALTIAVVLAAVVVPSVVQSLDRARVDRGQDSLEGIAAAIGDFEAAVGKYPASMTQLIQPIAAGQMDLCGVVYTWQEADRWDGPYVARVMPSAGLPIGVGTVQDAFVVVSATGGTDDLTIVVDGVEPGDALALDDRIDGDDSQSSGTIRWSAPDADGLVVLSYAIPFPDCSGWIP